MVCTLKMRCERVRRMGEYERGPRRDLGWPLRSASRVLCSLVLTLLPACSNSHHAGQDAGPADQGAWIVDQGPVRYPPLCDDSTPCPADSGVSYSCADGLCWERTVAGGSGSIMQPVCLYQPTGPVETTWTGEPCAITVRTGSGAVFGVSVLVELCVELRDPDSPASALYAGIFEEGCIWPDGVPVAAIAPETPCEGFAPVGSFQTSYRAFCGGTCGSAG